MALLDDLSNLVCELVAIESVNPDLVAAGSGESGIARFVASWLLDQGIAVSIVEPVKGRPSVVGVLKGSGGGRSLMLNAHMDTVGAGGMPRAFEPTVRDGRVYGRGAYDMKGSLGTSAVIEQFDADAAIVTEPTELKLCLAHKGFVWLEVETRGTAAHGSRPDAGIDAIGRMGRILTGVVNLDRRLRAGAGHRLLGRGSVHASLIEGGQEWSTYPARCVLKVERRTIPGEDATSSLGELKALIGIAREEDPRFEASARMVLERAPSELDADHPVAVAVASCAREAPGQDAEAVGVGYWMDMALINAAGIPTVAYGPAGEGAHADVEWVDLASLETCVQVYLRAAELLCGSSRSSPGA